MCPPFDCSPIISRLADIVKREEKPIERKRKDKKKTKIFEIFLGRFRAWELPGERRDERATHPATVQRCGQARQGRTLQAYAYAVRELVEKVNIGGE